MLTSAGKLYVVATPIGNLADMSPRAVEVLNAVDLILAEDTRHSAPLLRHFQISTPCRSFHDHNENKLSESLCEDMLAGKSLALISDAGTPLISDPGFPLLRAAHAKGIRVISIPGPCAAIAAIAASGLPVDRFSFEGFLPHKSEARKKVLQTLVRESRTMIFYESPHRVQSAVDDMCAVLGEARRIVFARELTKLHETIINTTLGALCDLLASDANQRRGEIVLVLEGFQLQTDEETDTKLDEMLCLLLAELPLKKAVGLAVELTGEKKNRVYQRALRLQQSEQ